MKAARDTPKRATKSVRPEGQAFRGNSRLPSLVEWPPASGDYERDCITGEKTALAFLAALEASGGDGSGVILRNVILGMPRFLTERKSTRSTPRYRLGSALKVADRE